MTHGSLFSGIGGFDLAAQWAGCNNIFQVEIDKYCQKVLNKNFPDTQKFINIKDFDGKQFTGKIDILSGGFPCQPFSVAGKREGKKDNRSLWDEMLRVISEIQPTWVIGENVPGIIQMELDNIITSLEGEGYEVQTFIIPAIAVDAKHRRDRVWIVSNNRTRWDSGELGKKKISGNIGILSDANQLNDDNPGYGTSEISKFQTSEICGHLPDNASEFNRQDHSKSSQRQKQQFRKIFGKTNIPDNDCERCKAKLEKRAFKANSIMPNCRWEPEPGVGRVVNGLSGRVDRLKGLGNAIVPQVAYEFFRMIVEIENRN